MAGRSILRRFITAFGSPAACFARCLRSRFGPCVLWGQGHHRPALSATLVRRVGNECAPANARCVRAPLWLCSVGGMIDVH